MVDEITATEAMEAGGTATGIQTTPEAERTAQATEIPEAGGTPGERLETGRTEWGATAAMAGATPTVIRTFVAAATAAWSTEVVRMELWNTMEDRHFATSPVEVHRSDETPRQYE